MSSLFAWRALLFAGECFAASAILLSLAWLASRILGQAAQRHFAWLTAFGTMLVFPLAAVVVPPQIVLHSRAVPAAEAPAAAVAAAPEAAAPDETSAAAPSPRVSRAQSFSLPTPDARGAAIALVALWLAGVGWAALRILAGVHGIARLRRESRPFALPPADMPPLACTRRECELRMSLADRGPLTWGILGPVILLPRSALSWPRERLQAVLLHELAHVRRRDSLTQGLSLLAAALYWINPLAWIGVRALRREAEIAADDAVIASGMRPSAYASELLHIASNFRGRRIGLSSVAMASPRSSLEARVRSVLAPNRQRTGVTFMDALKIAGFGIAALALLAAFRPDVVAAQDAPVPPAAPAAAAVPPAPQAVAVAAPAPQADPLPPADPPQAAPAAEESAVEAAAPDISRNHRHRIHIVRMKDGKIVEDRYSDAPRVEIRRAMNEMRRARNELARLEPTIRRAIEQAKIGAHVAAAMAKAQPAIDARVRAALAKAQPEIDRAIADAHISERVAKAIAEAQPKIDAAMVRIRKSMDRHGDIVIEREDSDTDLDAPGEGATDDGADSEGDSDTDSGAPPRHE
jgi:beta-lactamase regulating signal transducer with metallopeptidase domain